jgi:hypothetical protein
MKGHCGRCGVILDENNCSPAILRNGHGNCRVCRNAYMREYGAKNKDVIARKNKACHDKNAERYRGYRREYYANHKEERLAWFKKHITTPRGRHTQIKEWLRRELIPQTDSLWSLNYYTEILRDGVCHYCLDSLNLSGHGLDRMDNSNPHACWNVVPCCWECNTIKSSRFSYEEMMLLAPALREIRRRREATNVAATLCSMPPDS